MHGSPLIVDRLANRLLPTGVIGRPERSRLPAMQSIRGSPLTPGRQARPCSKAPCERAQMANSSRTVAVLAPASAQPATVVQDLRRLRLITGAQPTQIATGAGCRACSQAAPRVAQP